MKEKHDNMPFKISERSARQKTIDLLLKAGAFFIILEPIWMLLPFAGFIYGSVMHIQLLSRNPYTAWLVHFVLPTHTLFPLGLIMMVVGFAVFLAGAFQIYSAKFLKRGLVTNGIYRRFRHPQYLSLTLFGLGILLTWGRFITYMAFFIMMWLYYFLSKSEERKCLALFGKDYESYRENTWFLFPGERKLCALFKRISHTGLPTWANAAASFTLVVGLSIGSGFLIQDIKRQLRQHPPSIQGVIDLSKGGAQHVKLVMVKGPALQAAPFEKARHQFMNKAFEMLTSSDKIKHALYQIGLDENHTVLAFLNPGSNWHTGAHRDYRTAKVNALMVVTAPPLNSGSESIFQKNHPIPILKLIKVEALSYARMEQGQDPAEGPIRISGPPIGKTDASFQKRVRERINFFTSGL